MRKLRHAERCSLCAKGGEFERPAALGVARGRVHGAWHARALHCNGIDHLRSSPLMRRDSGSTVPRAAETLVRPW